MRRLCLLLFFIFYINYVHSKPLKTTSKVRKQVEEMDTDVFECPWCFEGDMRLTSFQKAEFEKFSKSDDVTEKNQPTLKRNKRKATSNLSERWPHAIIPYIIHSELEQHTEAILTGMRAWEEATCVRFHHVEPVELGDSVYLNFFKGIGCWSSVGKVTTSGAQEVSIGGGCQHVNSIIHEIGHSLGFFHEHSRYDRDNYIEIMTENILDGETANFNKFLFSKIVTEGVAYDTGSIMHYGPTFFSKSRQAPTIRARNVIDQYKLDNRGGLSFYDIKLANLIYNCNASCGELLSCENGGYVGPQCNCICKQGFSGTLCEVSEPANRGCAYQLTDTSGVIMSNNYPSHYENDQDCLIVISGQARSTIALTFEYFDVEQQNDCLYDYLEIEGYRYCGSTIPSRIESTSNELLMKFHSDASDTASGFKATYIIMNNLGEWSQWSDCMPACERGAKQERRRQCADDSCSFEERECVIESCVEVVTPVCGLELVEPRGYITSPGFPSDYANEEDCTILISGGEGKTIRLTFEYMELEYANGCVYDFLDIRSDNIDSEGIKYCGTELPPVTESVGGEMRLRFFSDASITAKGFVATYEIINHISEWTEWSNCPRTCGGGVQTRTRECIGSITRCNVGMVEERPCNEVPCSYIAIDIHVPCDAVSQWSDWTACSATCSTGTWQRSRSCESVKNIETVACNLRDCPVFSEWTRWSECVHLHGTYERVRLRFCTDGDHLCNGSPVETVPCDVNL